jgi:hypothetical protein
MNHALAVTILMAMSLPLAIHAQRKESPTSVDIAKTVNALVGHWIITGTDSEPGAKAPVKFELTVDCKRTALGAALVCNFEGKLPTVGPIEATAVIGYSPDEQVVRWMEISSTGEYHDHKGRWKGDQIEFEPLEYSLSGNKATEFLRVGFPASANLTLTSVTETTEGKSVLECTGKRVESKSR